MKRPTSILGVLVALAACSNQAGGGDDGGDDDVALPLGWSIDVDVAGLDRFAPADATTWTLAGKATASEGLDGVDVAGVAAPLRDGGAFSAMAAILPGLNPVPIVARDRAGHQRKAQRSILAARYLAAGAHNREAASLVLTDAVVASMAAGLANDDLLESVIAVKVGATASALLSGAAIALPELPGLGAPTAVTADAGGRFLRVQVE